MKKPVIDSLNSSLETLRNKLIFYQSELHKLFELGKTENGSEPKKVKAKARETLKAYRTADNELMNFKIKFHEDWFLQMKRGLEKQKDIVNLSIRLAKNPKFPLSYQTFLAAVQSLASIMMIIPGMQYSMLKKELETDYSKLPSFFEDFERLEKRTKASVIFCMLLTVLLGIIGLHPIFSIFAFVAGIVFLLIEKIHISNKYFPGSTFPLKFAKEAQEALGWTQKKFVILEEFSNKFLQIQLPTFPTNLQEILTKINQSDKIEENELAIATEFALRINLDFINLLKKFKKEK